MQVSTELPNTGISVGIELGDPLTIHPPNKQEVGKRLALVALEKAYGARIESSGPRFDSIKLEGSTLRVKFTHANGLTSTGGPPTNFAIAAEDLKFVRAEAKIEGDTVVLSNPSVTTPVFARYAWADNPSGCNLYNASGLPAAPFRTDQSQQQGR